MGIQARLQFLEHHQGKEAAEYVPADGLVALVKDWSGFQDAFHRAEDAFHHPQMLVLARYFLWGQIRVGSKDPFAVEAFFLYELGLVDGEVFLTAALDVSSIALVANKA